MLAVQSAPPASVQEYDFSYNISRGKFRFRLGEQEWICDKIAPDTQVWCRYSNSYNMHLSIVCEIELYEQDGEHWITAYPPEGEELERLKQEPLVLDYCISNWTDLSANEVGFRHPSQFTQGKMSHWRMCALKPHLITGTPAEPERGMWRFRDERDKNDYALYVVNGYHGLINMNWMDNSNHVFADDKAFLDKHGIVHFGGCCEHRKLELVS